MSNIYLGVAHSMTPFWLSARDVTIEFRAPVLSLASTGRHAIAKTAPQHEVSFIVNNKSRGACRQRV